MCAVWRYDKRAVNGQAAPVVYFATKLEALPPLEEEDEAAARLDVEVDPAAREALRVATYACACLDAVGFRDGPAHTEVKWPRVFAPAPAAVAAGADASAAASAATDDSAGAPADSVAADAVAAAGWGPLEAAGPAIVEVNARWHAAHTHPLTTACLGATSAVDATALALLAAAHADADAKPDVGGSGSEALLAAAAACWHALPPRCVRLRLGAAGLDSLRPGARGRNLFCLLLLSFFLGTAPCRSTAGSCTSSVSCRVGGCVWKGQHLYKSCVLRHCCVCSACG